MPSENAMDLVSRYAKEPHPSWKDQQLWLAKTIDAHTAEALAEHMRVLNECEKALSYGQAALEARLGIRYTTYSTEDGCGYTNDKTQQLEVVNSALAAIAKLKGKQD